MPEVVGLKVSKMLFKNLIKKEDAMKTLIFFDVSINPSQGYIDDGEFISIEDLIRIKSVNNHVIFQENGLVSSLEQCDILGIKKPSYWEKVMKTIIYCISGQIASRQEIVRGRQIIINLPRYFKKKYLDEQFVFCFLPYILIGFKTHLGDIFQSDSNKLDDMCKFIIHLFEQDSAEITSYLCAHRGFAPKGSHVLIDSIRKDRVKRTLNLQKGILANVPSLKHRKICWYQQFSTAMASSNMFPEMFIQYLESGRVPELLLILEKQVTELKKCLKDTTGLFDIKLLNLDSVTSKTCSFLDSRYGTDWRTAKFTKETYDGSSLIKIALEQVTPEIKRLTPFYGDSLSENFLLTRQEHLKNNLKKAEELEKSGSYYGITLRTLKAIDWFYYNQVMHISAKALYEAAFFYIWGKNAGLNFNRISIGIDRDHSEYQNSAWEIGYQDENQEKMPAMIIYARRVEGEIPGNSLEKISFRQFWR